MKYKLIILLTLALTACSKVGKSSFNAEIVMQTETQQDKIADQSMASAETNGERTREKIEPSALQRLLDAEYNYEPPNEVSADRFTDMEYLFLVQEEVAHFDDGGMPWYEYALLGGFFNTYEKGRNCYNEVNLLYEKWQVDTNYDKLKKRFGDGFIKQYYRRHIAAFSPDGETVLLKTYINPPYNDEVFYEIYDGLWYQHSYIYRDTIFIGRINYTKGLQYASLDAGSGVYPECGEIYTFYGTGLLSSYEYIKNAKQFEISITTDPYDVVYYKKDTDNQGDKCIGIYSILDNELIFQSETFEDYPVTVTIMDRKLIMGFTAKFHSSYLNYFEINMDTKESQYLFTNITGSFSPDGKYFACAARRGDVRGYSIYCVEKGELTFIKSYDIDTEPANYLYNNDVFCWVDKYKVEELLELVKQ